MEAFEIGISLALKDGVADGVAVARRDMQAVETALAEGAVSIQRLRDSAAAALREARGGSVARRGPGGVDTGASEEQPPAPVPDPGVKADGAAEKPQVWPRLDGAVPATREEETALRSPSERRGEAPPRPSFDGLEPGPEPKSAARPPSVTILHMGSLPNAAEQINDAVPSPSRISRPVGVIQAFSPPQAPAVIASVAAGRAGLLPGATPDDLGRSAAAAPVQGSPASHVSLQVPAGESAVPAAPSERGGDSRLPPEDVSSSSLPVNARAGWKAREAKSSGTAFIAADAAPLPEGLGPPSAAPAAPSGVSQESGPGGGDVYLDGVLLGRWISRHLAREAGRAPSGPTGFDMRRDPLLPGATVGM